MGSVAYEELLRREGRIITHVVGYSMLPLLRNRESIVIVESVDRVPPRQGDVVLYKCGTTYLLHRILQIRPDEYLIRGDNTRVLEHVSGDDLLATMTGFYRRAESRLVSRNNLFYRLYQLMLPCIRLTRRINNLIRRILRRWYRGIAQRFGKHR